MISQQFKKQLEVLSIGEIEGFLEWVNGKLKRDALNPKERNALRNLSSHLSDYIQKFRAKL